MNAFLYWLIFIGLYLFFGKSEVSRIFIVTVLISYGVLLFVNRWLLLIARSYLKRHKILVRKVMIIGYNDTAKKLASYLEEDDINTQIVGFCEEEENVHELSHYPILDSIDNTITASRFYDVKRTKSPTQGDTR